MVAQVAVLRSGRRGTRRHSSAAAPLSEGARTALGEAVWTTFEGRGSSGIALCRPAFTIAFPRDSDRAAPGAAR